MNDATQDQVDLAQVRMLAQDLQTLVILLMMERGSDKPFFVTEKVLCEFQPDDYCLIAEWTPDHSRKIKLVHKKGR